MKHLFFEKLLIASLVLSLIHIVASCTSHKRIYDRGSLSSLLFVPRPGHRGLTNQRCTQWDKDQTTCLARDTMDLDLSVLDDRMRLHAIKLICHVGNQEYRVCLELPGLCQQTVVSSGLFGMHKDIKLVSYLKMPDSVQYLVDMQTWCSSQDGDLNNP